MAGLLGCRVCLVFWLFGAAQAKRPSNVDDGLRQHFHSPGSGDASLKPQGQDMGSLVKRPAALEKLRKVDLSAEQQKAFEPSSFVDGRPHLLGAEPLERQAQNLKPAGWHDTERQPHWSPPHSPPRESTLLEERQLPQSVHKSWLERLGEAFWSLLIGLFIVIPFSIALLWINERRTAQLEVLLGFGEEEAQTVEVKQEDLANFDGTLVHLNSESALGLELVQDARFRDVRMESGCLRLRSTVQVYQWQEEKNEQTNKDNLGGGETTTASYTYEKSWCHKAVSSSGFRHSGEHDNSLNVNGLLPGVREEVNGTVHYGDCYRLATDMVTQLTNFQSAEELLGDKLEFESTHLESYSFKKQADSWYYYPPHEGEPEIGDFRVNVEYVLDGPVTVLALQLPSSGDGTRGFGPYRAVQRGVPYFDSAVDEEELKRRRLLAAEKGANERYEEEKCWDGGMFLCLCGACNVIAFLFTRMAVTQIYSAVPGKVEKDECFAAEKSAATLKSWGLRVLGWLMLWIGCMMLLEPLSVIADIIPFLGPFLGSGIRYMVGMLSFLLTVVLATLVSALAWLFYRPLVGAMYMALALVVIIFTMMYGHSSPL